MKIHFMAPVIRGNRENYKRIADVIEKQHHDLLTHHAIDRDPKQIETESAAEAELYSKKLFNWIKKADVIIFEVSQPDVSIGFEVASALNLNKPVIILTRKDSVGLPHALKGIHSDRLQLLTYDDSTLDEMLSLALEYAQETSDVRFNFFITPTISSYLDWVAKEKKIPRSVYLRRLIERDMEENDEYGV